MVYDIAIPTLPIVQWLFQRGKWWSMCHIIYLNGDFNGEDDTYMILHGSESPFQRGKWMKAIDSCWLNQNVQSFSPHAQTNLRESRSPEESRFWVVAMDVAHNHRVTTTLLTTPKNHICCSNLVAGSNPSEKYEFVNGIAWWNSQYMET